MKRWPGCVLKALGVSLAAALLLVALLLTVFSVQASLRETAQRGDAAPPGGRFVQAGDTELFVQEIGPPSGPAVVFIHGAGAWSGLWHDTMRAVAAAGFRCIAIDIPPFGFSQRSDVAAYGRDDQARRIVAALDALGIERATLVGHSFGGGATVETALLIPDRIEAMVLADIGGLGLRSSGQQSARPPSVGMALFEQRPLRNALVASTLTNPLLSKAALQTLILDPADATPERVAILQRPLALQGSTDALGDWLLQTMSSAEISLSSDPASYRKLTMPVLLIWGEQDSTVPVAEGVILNGLLPDSRLVIMPGVDHIPHIEDPETFNALVVNFLR